MHEDLKKLINTAVSDCRAWGRGYGIDDESDNEYEVDAYWQKDVKNPCFSILNVDVRKNSRKFVHITLDRVSNAFMDTRCLG